MIEIIGKDGRTVAMTCRYGHVRQLLREGKAKTVEGRPLTVQLTGSSRPAGRGQAGEGQEMDAPCQDRIPVRTAYC